MMGYVTIMVAGRSYRLACDDGEEEHVQELGRRLDETIDELRRAFGEIGDQRLTVMAAILTSDRLHESQEKFRALELELEALRADHAKARQRSEAFEARLVKGLEQAADRIERLAVRLSGVPPREDGGRSPSS
jgi:cell division protein ZapA